MVIDPKFPQGSSLTRSTPAGVTLVHFPLAGTGVGWVATATDGRLVRATKATAKILAILSIANSTQLDHDLKVNAAR